MKKLRLRKRTRTAPGTWLFHSRADSRMESRMPRCGLVCFKPRCGLVCFKPPPHSPFLLPVLALSSNPFLQLSLLRFHSFTLEQEKNPNSVLKFLNWRIFKNSIVSLLRTMLIPIYLPFFRARYTIK